MENISSTQNQFSTGVESNIIFDYKQELEKYKLLYDAEQQEVIRLRKKQENIDIAFITLKNMTEKVVSLYKENMNLKTELANLHSFISEYYRSEATSIEKVFPYAEAGKIQDIREYGKLETEEYREDGIFVKAMVPPFLA